MSAIENVQKRNGQFFVTVNGITPVKFARKYGVKISARRYWFTPDNWSEFKVAVSNAAKAAQ